MWTKFVNAARYAGEVAAARFHLRNVDRMGARCRTISAPDVRNQGTMEIGERLLLMSWFAPVQLATGPSGKLQIGDRVAINFGTAVSARKSVRIGNRVGIGPYSLISDTHSIVGAGTDPSGEEPQPVVIEDDVWLATRVTVLPGSRIGAGSVIAAGSIVSGEIPPGVVAGGIPARVLRRLTPGAAPMGGAPEASLPPVAAPPPPRGEPTAAAQLTRNVLLAGDSTLDLMATQFAAPGATLQLRATVAPFGQVMQALLEPGPGADYALVWTQPELAVPSFGRLAAAEEVPLAQLLQEVDAFSERLAFASSFRAIFAASWTLPPWQRGLGLLDGTARGLTRALAAMNLRLMERVSESKHVHVLNAQRWVDAAPRGGYTPSAWYSAKSLFHPETTAEAAREVRAAVNALEGRARKVVVLDLDDTLWGGVVGDAGWQNLRLGGHDAVGEALVDFQRGLKALSRRGVLLALCSKNTEAVALEAMRLHPEMVLREGDFAARRINWNDKAANLVEIARELKLGLQSLVFIDDNPVERARVREALPEVLVPEWPQDPTLYPSALARLRCFDQAALTAEDAGRTQLYADEKERESLKAQVGSLDEWLRSLGLRVRIAQLNPRNLTRAAQLFNKTNQMNLATRRLTEAELLAWQAGGRRELWTVSVADRFGDAGLTGIVSIEASGVEARIVDFILSCRVMGRKVEEAMLHLAVSRARSLGARKIDAQLLPTPKNLPCAEFWKRSGFTEAAGNVFTWTGEEYALPGSVAIESEA